MARDVAASRCGSSSLDAARPSTAAGVPSPRVDAEMLAAHLLGVAADPARAAPAGRRPTGSSSTGALVARRAAADPAAAPARHRARWARRRCRSARACSSRARRPRSLLEWALQRHRRRRRAGGRRPVHRQRRDRPGHRRWPGRTRRCIAVERSPAALAWARRNVERHAAQGGTPGPAARRRLTDQRLLADLDGTRRPGDRQPAVRARTAPRSSPRSPTTTRPRPCSPGRTVWT